MNYVIKNEKTNKFVCMNAKGETFFSHWGNKAFVYDNLEDALEDISENGEYVYKEESNLMGGGVYWERYDTPIYCSPSSESYWSM